MLMRQPSLFRSNLRVEHHLDLARQLAVRYARRTGYDRDDLHQVGLIGLIKASRAYQSTMQVPFEVFARPHIRGEILHYLRDSVALVRLPRRVEEEGLRLSKRAMDPLDARQQMVLDEYRSKGRWLPLDSVAGHQATNQIDDAGWQESRLLIRKTFAALPRAERNAVEATVLEGLSLRAAGQRLDVSAMTVQRRLKRGLQRMATSLRGAEFSE